MPQRMHASIVGILAEKVMCLGFDGAAQLYREYHQVDFASMGHTPCALFVTVSDIDRNPRSADRPLYFAGVYGPYS